LTVTSNIHTGLAAWSNHSFALNEACSNAGNAYRCTTAGSSTAAPTGTGTGINNGGVAVFKWLSTYGASDYSTIDAWVTSIPGTLAQAYEGLIWNNGDIVRTTYVSITGHTTTAANIISLKCAPGESFADNPNRATNPLIPSASYGVQISRSGNYSYNIILQEDYGLLDGLQLVRAPGAIHQNASLALGKNGSSGTTTVSRMVVRGENFEQANNGIIGAGGSSSVDHVNCVFIDESVAGSGSPIWNGQNNSCSFTNCVMIALNSQAGFDAIHRNYSGTTTVTNCIIMGWGGIGNANLTSGVARNNVVNWTSYPSGWTDTGTLFSKTAANQFVGIGTDFKLKAGADALNTGYTDTVHIPSATDIYGTTRPQGSAWDVGPYETPASSAAFFDYIAEARLVRQPPRARQPPALIAPVLRPVPGAGSPKTLYMLNTAATTPDWFGVMQDGGTAPTAAASAFGWTTAKTATTTPFWRARIGATATATVASATSNLDFAVDPNAGTGATITTSGDAFRSPVRYAGTFGAGNWTLNFGMRTLAATVVGNMRCRIWAGPASNGVNARELTSGALTGSTVSMIATATTYTSTITWNAPTIILDGEYLFFQVEWNETTAGTSNSCAVVFYQSACTIATANWSAAAGVTAATTIAGQGQFDTPDNIPQVFAIGTAQQKTGGGATPVTLTANVPAGSLIVIYSASVTASGGASFNSPPTDSAGNVYTQVPGNWILTTPSFGVTRAYCPNCLALSAGQTITIPIVGTALTAAISIFYATGLQRSVLPTPQSSFTQNTAITNPSRNFNPSLAYGVLIGVSAVAGDVVETFTNDTTHNWTTPPLTRVGNTGGVANTNATLNGAWKYIQDTTQQTYSPTLGTARENVIAVENWGAATQGRLSQNLAAAVSIAGVGAVAVDATRIGPAVYTANATLAGVSGRTNSIRNPRAEGAVAGTPGTAPTFWNGWGDNLGLTFSIIGIGTEDGIPYIDVRYAGTTNVAGFFTTAYFEPTGTAGIPSGFADTWWLSFYHRLVGGSTVNTTGVQAGWREFNAAGTAVAVHNNGAPFDPTTAPLISQRQLVVGPGQNLDRNTYYVSPFWGFGVTGSGVAIDITFRIGAPQFELGSNVSGLILPPIGTPGISSRAIEIRERVSAVAKSTIAGLGAVAADATVVAGTAGTTYTGAVTIGTLPSWNPLSPDAPATTLFTNNNRTITKTAGGFDGAKGNSVVSSGKFYAEFTPGSGFDGNSSFGVATTALTTYFEVYSPSTHCCIAVPGMGVLLNGSNTGILFSWSTASIAMALDMDNKRIWFRQLPSGNWNDNASNSPTTPSTGLDISGLVPVTPLFIVTQLGVNSGISATVEMGLGSFANTPPSGYTVWPSTPGGTGYVKAYATVHTGTVTAAATIAGVSGRTNYIRNPRAEGAVAGTPGSIPTYWRQIVNNAGLTQQIVGTGVENGIDYIDVRFTGSTPGGGEITIQPAQDGDATPVPRTSTWASSFYMRIIPGDASFIDYLWVSMQSYANSGGQVDWITDTYFTPSTLVQPGGLGTRYVSVANNATTTAGADYMRQYIYVDTKISGAALDFTLRIGWPQLENVETTGNILPPVGAPAIITRAIEIYPRLQAVAAVTIGGVGTIAVDATRVAGAGTQWTGATTIVAAGNVAVSAVQRQVAVSTIAAAGNVAVDARRIVYAASTSAGVAVVSVAAVQRQVAASTIAGLGAVSDSAVLRARTVSTIGGLGNVRAWDFHPVYTASTTAGVSGRTNVIRNPRGEGGRAGDPSTSEGSPPTYWTGWGNPPSGLFETIAGVGYEDGIPYIDIHLVGTVAGSTAYYPHYFEDYDTIPVPPRKTWSSSIYVRLVGGSTSNVASLAVGWTEYSSKFADIIGDFDTGQVPTSAPLSSQRYSYANPTTALATYIRPYWKIYFTSLGVPVDIIIRIGGPQLELGPSASGLILPPVGVLAVTSRAIEIRDNVKIQTNVAMGGVGRVVCEALVRNPAGHIAYDAFATIAATTTFSPVNVFLRQSAVTSIAGLGGQANYIRNPRFEGAVAGTPGTVPTYFSDWSAAAASVGLSLTILGTGYEDGIPYIDVRIFGTTDGVHYSSDFYYFETNTAIPAGYDQGWLFSFYLKQLVGEGIWGPVSMFYIGWEELDENGVHYSNHSDGKSAFTGPLWDCRHDISDTNTFSDVRFIRPYWGFGLDSAAAVPFDNTLRIGAPQLELGYSEDGPSDLILPPVGAPAVSFRAIQIRERVTMVAAVTIAGAGNVAAILAPDWVSPGAQIHIDFIGGSPQGRAWVQGVGVVGINTLVGNDPLADAGWTTTGYNSAELTPDGYLPTMSAAFIGEARNLLLTATTVRTVHTQTGQNISGSSTGCVVLSVFSPSGDNGVEIDLTPFAPGASSHLDVSTWGGPAYGDILGAANSAVGAINVTAYTVTANRLEADINGYSTPIALTLIDADRPTADSFKAAIFDHRPIQGGYVAVRSIQFYAPLPTAAGLIPLSALPATIEPVASMAATGNVAVSARQVSYGATTIAGVASIAVDATKVAPAGTVWTAAVTIAAIGNVAASAVQRQVAASTSAGIGSVAINAIRAQPAASTSAGLGAVGVAAIQRMVAASTSAGVGTVGVAAGKLIYAATTIAGVGNVSAAAVTPEAAAAGIPGFGTVSVTAIQRQFATIAIAGVGAFGANSAGSQPGNVAIAGQAAVSVDAIARRFATIPIAGQGSVAVDAGKIVYAAATIGGVGSVAASAGKLIYATASIAGVGNVTADAQFVSGAVSYTAATTIAGVGSITASATLNLPAAIAIAATGSVAASAVLNLPAATTIAGLGAFAASAAAAGVQTATITIGGLGNVAVDARRSSPAIASIDSQGAVSVAAAQLQFAAVSVAGVGNVLGAGGEAQPAAASIVGVGAVSAAAGGIRPAAVATAAQGAVSAGSVLTQVTAVAVAGLGTVSIAAGVRQFATVSIGGVGTLLVNAIQQGRQEGTTAIAASATVSISTTQRMVAASAIAAQASVSIDAARITYGATSIAAQGSVAVDAYKAQFATIAIAGQGAVNVNATALRAAVVTIDAQASVTVRGNTRQVAATQIDGVGGGGFTAYAMCPVSAIIVGQGNVQIGSARTIFMGVDIAGAGHVAVSARTQALASQARVMMMA